MLRAWQAQGYEFQLVFVWLSDASLAEARVRRRVARGGHDIPADIVRRRYERGLSNLFNLYLPIADAWRLLDNSGPGQPALLAARHVNRPAEVLLTSTWQNLQDKYMGTPSTGSTPPRVAEPRTPDPLSAHIVAAADRAVRAALREHKLLGFPIAVWHDGRIVMLPPDEIPVETNPGNIVSTSYFHAARKSRCTASGSSA